MAKQEVGRLALRVEGSEWVAYYAMQGTMEGALRLASIKMGLVQRRERKQAFMDLMTASVGDMLSAASGTNDVTWNAPTDAPEHERSGSA